MLAKSKLNNVKTVISQALIDLEISHNKFKTMMKENIRNIKSNDELSENNKNIRKDSQSV